MNSEQSNRASGAAVGFVLAVVVFVALPVGVKLLVDVPAVDAVRGAERSKALAEILAAEEKSLNTLAITDRQRGVIQLPVEMAMKLAAEKWQNPAAARADLAARAEKATAPVKPVSFE